MSDTILSADERTNHVFPMNDGPFVPSEPDFERARSLPADACPRRYCFNWDSPSFHWERSPKEGCLFLVGEKPGWKFAGIPCCRSDASSVVDHFEPNERFAEADGMDLTKWIEYRLENQRITLSLLSEREKKQKQDEETDSGEPDSSNT